MRALIALAAVGLQPCWCRVQIHLPQGEEPHAEDLDARPARPSMLNCAMRWRRWCGVGGLVSRKVEFSRLGNMLKVLFLSAVALSHAADYQTGCLLKKLPR